MGDAANSATPELIAFVPLVRTALGDSHKRLATLMCLSERDQPWHDERWRVVSGV